MEIRISGASPRENLILRARFILENNIGITLFENVSWALNKP